MSWQGADIDQILDGSLAGHAGQSRLAGRTGGIRKHAKEFVAGRQRPGWSIGEQDERRIVSPGSVKAVGAFRFQRVLDNDRDISRRDGFKGSRRNHGADAPFGRKITYNLRLQCGGDRRQFIHADLTG